MVMINASPYAPDSTMRAYIGRRRPSQLLLRIAGAAHATFSDLAVHGRALTASNPALRKELGPFGSIGPARAIRVERAYLAAFFDVHLRRGRSRLLRGPSRAFPEVRFLR